MKDENFYLLALQEIEQGKGNKALATKAFAKAEGNEQRSKALYLEYRVAELKEEAALEAIRQKSQDSVANRKAFIAREAEKRVEPVSAVHVICYILAVGVGLFVLFIALANK